MASNIADTHAFPYTAVANINDTIGSTAQHGSGVLIAPDELLTTAHLVFTTGVGTASAGQISVQVDRNDTDTPFGTSSVTDFHYFSINDVALGGSTRIDAQADFALLHLSAPISAAATMTPTVSFGGGPVHITGYRDSAGHSFMMEFLTSANSDRQNPPLSTGFAADNSVDGGPIWQFNGSTAQLFGIVSFSTVGADMSVPVLTLLNSWMAADHAGGLSGAIAAPPPPLLHAINPDIGALGVDPQEAALVDTFSYYNQNLDVAHAGVDPAQHFALYGWHENRAPNPLFDVQFYLQHNPDVAAAGMDPLLHFALYGWKEGRDPSSHFSTKQYLADNPDVQQAGMDPLQHYLTYGINEFRTTTAIG